VRDAMPYVLYQFWTLYQCGHFFLTSSGRIPKLQTSRNPRCMMRLPSFMKSLFFRGCFGMAITQTDNQTCWQR